MLIILFTFEYLHCTAISSTSQLKTKNTLYLLSMDEISYMDLGTKKFILETNLLLPLNPLLKRI